MIDEPARVVHAARLVVAWDASDPRIRPIDILLVCTANQCRSAMAEGLVVSLLRRYGARAHVGSAGLLRGGMPATDEAIAVMADRGVDISHHVSRTIDATIVRSAPLVVGMARQHVREAVVTYGADIQRTFTLKEIVRRGEEVGPRRHDETVFDWLARVGAGRRSADLMGADHSDDVADPVGQSRAVYEATADELEALLRRLVALLIGDRSRTGVKAEPGAGVRPLGDVPAHEANSQARESGPTGAPRPERLWERGTRIEAQRPGAEGPKNGSDASFDLSTAQPPSTRRRV